MTSLETTVKQKVAEWVDAAKEKFAAEIIISLLDFGVGSGPESITKLVCYAAIAILNAERLALDVLRDGITEENKDA